jgi:hypothetical protein
MKNPFSLLSPESLLENLRSITNRFPISVVLIVIMSGVWYYIVNESPDDVFFARLLFTLIVTFFISVGLTLFAETRKEKNIIRFLPLLSILYGVFFYFTFDVRESM